MTEADLWRAHFAGRPFSAVFTHPRTYPDDRWRIRSSGVHTRPDDAPATAAVLAVCEALGVPTAIAYSGGPCSADAWPVVAPFPTAGSDCPAQWIPRASKPPVKNAQLPDRRVFP